MSQLYPDCCCGGLRVCLCWHAYRDCWPRCGSDANQPLFMRLHWIRPLSSACALDERGNAAAFNSGTTCFFCRNNIPVGYCEVSLGSDIVCEYDNFPRPLYLIWKQIATSTLTSSADTSKDTSFVARYSGAKLKHGRVISAAISRPVE